MPAWIIPLIFELLKLLPAVIKFIKEHPLADKKEVVKAFPKEVDGLLKKLKDRREGVGSAPDLVS